MLCLLVLQKHGFCFKMETNQKRHYRNAKRRHNMESIIYVGMDVHKETYSLCCYDPRTDRYLYEHKMKAATGNVLKYLESVRKQMKGATFICGYEAGPTGFGLCRDLLRKDIACVVMAPPANHRVKNDKTDARLLAKDLFTHSYSPVHLSSEKEEAVKEFCRMRRSIMTELKAAKQVLCAFLLRQGKHFEGKTHWTKGHREWLRKLTFEQPYLQESFDEYVISVNALEERLKRIEKRLEEIACDEEVGTKVKKLVCFCGIDTLTAVSIVSEEPLCEGVGFRKFCRAVRGGAFLRAEREASRNNKVRKLLFKETAHGKRKEHKKDKREIQEIKKTAKTAGRQRSGRDCLCG